MRHATSTCSASDSQFLSAGPNTKVISPFFKFLSLKRLVQYPDDYYPEDHYPEDYYPCPCRCFQAPLRQRQRWHNERAGTFAPVARHTAKRRGACRYITTPHHALSAERASPTEKDGRLRSESYRWRVVHHTVTGAYHLGCNRNTH